MLQTADFPFKIPVPEGLPPTARLDKQCGISYELVASLCVKGKKGLLKKEATSSIIQAVHPIVIEKHDLHSTWPAYNVAEEHRGENEGVRCRVERYQTCHAPGDKVKVKVVVQSTKIDPVKLKSVAFSVRETVTFHGGKASRLSLTSNSATNRSKPASQRTETLTQKAKQLGKKLYKGDSLEYELECAIPKHHALMTISTAKHVEVSYTMRVYVDVSKAPIIIDHLPLIMTTSTRTASWETMRKIGYVEGLSLDDAASTISGSQAGRGMLRSQSFNGSAASFDRRGSAGRPASSHIDTNNLRRRDTVMTQATNFSGPGMAGRGVPGQLFSYSYGSYGAVNPYQNEEAPAPRSAFAGPQGNSDALELSHEERVAMFHHSNRPQDAEALGDEYRVLNAPGHISSEGAARPHFQAIKEEEGGSYSVPDVHQRAVQQHLQQHHNSQHQPNSSIISNNGNHPRFQQALSGYQSPTAMASPTSAASPVMAGGSATFSNNGAASAAAEAEKIRLYNRAREQAEKNQRRADQQRQLAQASSTSPLMSQSGQSQSARLLSSSGDFGSQTPTREGTPQKVSFAQASPSQPSSGSLLVGSEEEKKRLWERARREAEAYQKRFTEGVSFPAEEVSSDSKATASQPATVDSSATALQAPAAVEDRRPSSGMYWLDSPTVDPNEARGHHAPLVGPVDQGNVSASSIRNSTQQPSFPSAADEKQRLYNEAKAQTDAHVRAASGQYSPPKPSSLSHVTTVSQPVSSANVQPAPIMRQESSTEASSRMIPGSPSAPIPAPTNALDEKAQQAKYYAAQDAVARHQGQQSTSSNANPALAATSSQSAAPLASASYATAPPQSRPPSSFANPVSAMSGAGPSSSAPSSSAGHGRVMSGPALSEKEQMRLYYEARERQAESERAAQSTPAGPPPPPPLQPPHPAASAHRPQQSQGQNLPVQQAHVQHAPPPPLSMHAPIAQAPASFVSSPPPPPPRPNGGSKQEDTSTPPVLPALRFSSESNPGSYFFSPTASSPPPSRTASRNTWHIGRTSTPTPVEGPWAPKIASSWSIADDDEETHASGPSSQAAPRAGAAPPPPLPPKTLASTRG